MLRRTSHVCWLLLTASAGASAAVQSEPERWQAVEDLRIGRVDGGPATLSDVVDIGVDRAGRIYIVQAVDRSVRIFDSAGQYVGEAGRRGRGPGEFESLGSIQLLDDGFYVYDPALLRGTQYDGRRQLVRTWQQQSPPGRPELVAVPPVAIMNDGSALFRSLHPQGEREIDTVEILRKSSAGDWSLLAELAFADARRRVSLRDGSWVAVIPQPVNFGDRWVAAHDGDGIVVARQDADRPGWFQLVRIAASGDTLLVKSYESPPVRVDRRRVAAERIRAVERAARGREELRPQLDELYRIGFTVPEMQASVDDLVQGIDGSVWVRRGAFGMSESRWDVFDGEFLHVASVMLRSSLRPLRASFEYIWAADHGEWDEPIVRRLRLVRE